MVTCSIEECDRKATSRGWCSMHYKRWVRHSDPRCLVRASVTPYLCTVEGCVELYWAKGMCSRHYGRSYHNKPIEAPFRRYYDIGEECIEPHCTKQAVNIERCASHAAVVFNLKNGRSPQSVYIAYRPQVLAIHGWFCHLCKDVILDCFLWPDPWSLTIDHVIPVSMGGSHELDNLRPAHAYCNLSKGGNNNPSTREQYLAKSLVK